MWVSTSLFGWALAFVYSYVAACLGSFIAYEIGRRLGRDWAQQHVPERVRSYQDRIAERPIATVLLLRTLLWANPAVDLFLAVSPIGRRQYLFGTLVGLVATTVFQMLLGAGGIEVIKRVPQWAVTLSIGLALLGIGIWIWRRSRVKAPSQP